MAERKGPVRTHHTAVVIIPPPDLWEPIQAVRRRYDRKLRRWMPHVNLLYPFQPAAWFDTLEGRVARVLRAVEPFEIRLERFESFHHGGGRYTLWLAPEPRERIADLHAVLEATVPGVSETARHAAGFTPHLSVGQVRGRRRMEALRTDLARTWPPLRFQVASVCFIRRGSPPDDVFRVDRRIPLGG